VGQQQHVCVVLVSHALLGRGAWRVAGGSQVVARSVQAFQSAWGLGVRRGAGRR